MEQPKRIDTTETYHGAAHQQELRPAKDQLGDAPVPPRGPGAREGAGAGPLQDFLPDEH